MSEIHIDPRWTKEVHRLKSSSIFFFPTDNVTDAAEKCVGQILHAKTPCKKKKLHFIISQKRFLSINKFSKWFLCNQKRSIRPEANCATLQVQAGVSNRFTHFKENLARINVFQLCSSKHFALYVLDVSLLPARFN